MMSQYVTTYINTRWAHALALAPLLIVCPLACATPAASSNYVLPSSAVNSSVAGIASANFKLSLALGDTVHLGRDSRLPEHPVWRQLRVAGRTFGASCASQAPDTRLRGTDSKH